MCRCRGPSQRLPLARLVRALRRDRGRSSELVQAGGARALGSFRLVRRLLPRPVERAAFFAVDGRLEALFLVVAGALFLAAVFVFLAIL